MTVGSCFLLASSSCQLFSLHDFFRFYFFLWKETRTTGSLHWLAVFTYYYYPFGTVSIYLLVVPETSQFLAIISRINFIF
jgi:hypothetical protein